MATRYPLSVDDQRKLANDYDGAVFIWDIDKTYLSTRFSSMKGLASVPIEFAVDKHAIPGMPEVLRGLRRGPGQEFECLPLYFISASPPQLRKVVEKKMLLDGVEHDGITFKDWWGTIKQLRPGRLKEQLGFKLNALLEGRTRRPMSREYLFGDDVESDAEAFSLYAAAVNAEISSGDMESRLESSGVQKDDRQLIHEMITRLPTKRGLVEKCFIHLELNSPPERFSRLGSRIVPVKGGFQLSLALYELGLVDSDSVTGAKEAVESSPKTLSKYGSVQQEVDDAQARGLIGEKKLKSLKL